MFDHSFFFSYSGYYYENIIIEQTLVFNHSLMYQNKTLHLFLGTTLHLQNASMLSQKERGNKMLFLQQLEL